MSKEITIQHAQLEQLLSASNASLITSTLLAFVLAYVQRDVVNSSVILPWLIFVVLVALARAGLAVKYKRTPVNDGATILKRLKKFRFGVLMTGALWGLAGWILFPADDPQHQMFLIFMLAGLTAGGMISYVSDIVIAVTFSLLTLIPAIIHLIYLGDDVSYAMGMAGMIYLSFILISIRYINKNKLENISLHLAAIEREKSVKKSKERYRMLLDNSPIGIFHYDKNLVITYCNDYFAKTLKNTIENIIGIEMSKLSDQSILSALNKVFVGEFGYYEGHYSATFSDVKKWINLTCAPSLGADEAFEGGIGILHDNTTRKNSEEKIRIHHEWHHAILNGTMDGYWLVNAHGRLLEVNQAYCIMSGYHELELLTMHIFDLEAYESEAEVAIHIQRIVSQGEDRFESQHRHKNGGIFDVEVSVQYRDIDGGQFVVFLQDISNRKIFEENRRIASIAFEVQESIIVFDANKVILRVNKAFTETTGYTAEEVVGSPPLMLRSELHDVGFYAEIWDCVDKTGAWKGEIYCRRKNSEIYPSIVTISAVKNVDNTISNYVTTLVDITNEKISAEEIQFLAFYDSLTGLANRRLLVDRLDHALLTSVRNGKDGALLFIDLDHFKTLNDTLGHDLGDLLLQQVAKRLTACVRDGDTVARLGGDEYVVLLENLSEHPIETAMQAEAISAKILSALNEPYQLDAHEYHNSPSIGVALFSDHGQSQEDLLKHADIAMYQAKKAGRNTLRFFDPQMQHAIHVRADLERELRKAIERQQLQLHYQVQVDGAGNAIGAEVLVRWIHPERGLISPLQFIPLAEETGLIVPIGEWVLETACAQLEIWQHHEPIRDISLSINVSALSFRQVGFADGLQTAIARHDINPMLLKLELTESILLEDVDGAIVAMSALDKIGVKIALDDFGTGYSSLQYLKRLPIHQLKIDRSFVSDIVINDSDQTIVRTIIAMAQSLELEVIVEGVETEAQHKLLVKKGCKYFQGYLFGKPLPIAEFEATFPED